MRSNFSGNYTRKDVVGEKSPRQTPYVMLLIYKMDGVVNTTRLMTLGAKVTHTWIPIAQITDYQDKNTMIASKDFFNLPKRNNE